MCSWNQTSLFVSVWVAVGVSPLATQDLSTVCIDPFILHIMYIHTFRSACLVCAACPCLGLAHRLCVGCSCLSIRTCVHVYRCSTYVQTYQMLHDCASTVIWTQDRCNLETAVRKNDTALLRAACECNVHIRHILNYPYGPGKVPRLWDQRLNCLYRGS